LRDQEFSGIEDFRVFQDSQVFRILGFEGSGFQDSRIEDIPGILWVFQGFQGFRVSRDSPRYEGF